MVGLKNDQKLILLVVVVAAIIVLCPSHVRGRQKRIEGSANFAPEILQSSHFQQQFKLGMKLLLICQATGRPQPTIKWFRESSEFKPNKNTWISNTVIQYDVIGGRNASVIVKSRLEIDPATVGDRGDYTCLAENPNGKAFRNFHTDFILS